MLGEGKAENIRIRDRTVFNKAAAILRHRLPISRAGRFFGFAGHKIKVNTDSGVVQAMSRLVLDLYKRMDNPNLVKSELLQLRAKVLVLERERDFWKDFSEEQTRLLEDKEKTMGLTKRWMESEEAKREEATNIAVAAGVLERCDFHEEIVCDMFGDPTDAYKLANYRFTRDQLQEDYKSPRELTDKIQEAIEESSDGCPFCAKELAD